MTTDLIFNSGEEMLVKQGFDGETVEVALYLDDPNQGGDDLGEFADESEVSTEPASANYSRQTITLSASQNDDNNWVGENSEQMLFDFADVVQDSPDATDVDAALVIHSNYGPIANPSMTTLRNTAAFDELEIAPADFGIGVDGTPSA